MPERSRMKSVDDSERHFLDEEAPPGMPIFTTANCKPLDVDTVVDILRNSERYSSIACNSIPADPKAGNVFLFIPKSDAEQGNYKQDQYMWINHGPKSIPAKSPIIQKQYYVAKLPDGRPSKFHKSVYSLLHDRRPLKPCIVQYMGSMDGIAISTKRSRNQVSRQSGESSCGTPFKKGRTYGIGSVAVARPVSVQPRKLPVNRDDFRQLHELAYNLNGFINSLHVSPKFYCILSSKELTEHLEAILQVNANSSDIVQFSYCTSYEFDGLVLSSLSFTHVSFDGRPAIPSHFIIHEKDDSTFHEELFRTVLDQVPSLKTIVSPIVTEADPVKDNCIAEMGLKMVPVSSWKETIVLAKEWLYANGANQQEVATGLDDMRKLMSHESVEKYEEGLLQCREHWGESLQEYYATNIDPMVRAKLGRWLLDKWNFFNPYTGVNDIKNDCLELVVQHLQSMGNVTACNIVLACYLVQLYVKKEIKDGINNIGRFIARDNSAIFKASVSSWKPVPFLCLPDNIVPYIKNDQLIIQDGNLVQREEIDARKALLSKGKRIYENRGVHHDWTMQAFIVKDMERPGEGFLVKLHPRATCSCDSTMFCQHIIAVKISIGVDMENDMERLDSKFVTRALKSCENAADGIKPKRRRRKKQENELTDFGIDAVRKRDASVLADFHGKGNEGSEVECESENESDVTGNGQDTTHVEFFQAGGQMGFNMGFQ